VCSSSLSPCFFNFCKFLNLARILLLGLFPGDSPSDSATSLALFLSFSDKMCSGIVMPFILAAFRIILSASSTRLLAHSQGTDSGRILSSETIYNVITIFSFYSCSIKKKIKQTYILRTVTWHWQCHVTLPISSETCHSSFYVYNNNNNNKKNNNILLLYTYNTLIFLTI